MSVTDTDHGYLALLGMFKALNTSAVVVRTGIRGSNAEQVYRAEPDPNPGGQKRRAVPSNEGLTLGEIALINEFGSPSSNIPARPAFRQAFDKNRAKYVAGVQVAVDAAYSAIVGGGGGDWNAGMSTLKKALGRVGAVHAGDIQESIRNLRSPPNAPYTIWKKGSSNPLIDTGRMRQSVDFEVVTIRGKLP